MLFCVFTSAAGYAISKVTCTLFKLTCTFNNSLLFPAPLFFASPGNIQRQGRGGLSTLTFFALTNSN